MFGKYLNGYGLRSDGTEATYVPPGWDHWAALPNRTLSSTVVIFTSDNGLMLGEHRITH
jgi:hypothetical protein